MALCLARKAGESIVIIANNVKIKVIVSKISRHNVKLCIDAPRNVIVHREEILDKIIASEASQHFCEKPVEQFPTS